MMYRAVKATDYMGGYFKVSGGPFSHPQTMGWHITDEKGFTVAVSPDYRFADQINTMTELLIMLKKMDAIYHLDERRDQGYLEVDYSEWSKFKEMFEGFTKSFDL